MLVKNLVKFNGENRKSMVTCTYHLIMVRKDDVAIFLLHPVTHPTTKMYILSLPNAFEGPLLKVLTYTSVLSSIGG